MFQRRRGERIGVAWLGVAWRRAVDDWRRACRGHGRLGAAGRQGGREAGRRACGVRGALVRVDRQRIKRHSNHPLQPAMAHGIQPRDRRASEGQGRVAHEVRAQGTEGAGGTTGCSMDSSTVWRRRAETARWVWDIRRTSAAERRAGRRGLSAGRRASSPCSARSSLHAGKGRVKKLR